jgi:hypothetical protein
VRLADFRARDIATAHSSTLAVEDSERGARLVLCLPLASARRPGTENVGPGS